MAVSNPSPTSHLIELMRSYKVKDTYQSADDRVVQLCGVHVIDFYKGMDVHPWYIDGAFDKAKDKVEELIKQCLVECLVMYPVTEVQDIDFYPSWVVAYELKSTSVFEEVTKLVVYKFVESIGDLKIVEDLETIVAEMQWEAKARSYESVDDHDKLF